MFKGTTSKPLIDVQLAQQEIKNAQKTELLKVMSDYIHRKKEEKETYKSLEILEQKVKTS